MRCQCLTAKGSQCSRNAKGDSKYCYQHQQCKAIISMKKIVAEKKTICLTIHNVKYWQNVRYCASDCLPEMYKVGTEIGSGLSGIAYDVTRSDGVNMVLKFMPLETPIPLVGCDLRDASTWDDCSTTSEKEFYREAELTKLFGDNNIGPRVFDIIVCEKANQNINPNLNPVKLGLIVMEHGGITLRTYAQQHYKKFRENIPFIKKKVKKLVKLLAEQHGYIMRDLHFGNIVVKINKKYNITDLQLIDFGDVYKGTEWKNTYRLFVELSLNIYEK